MSFTLYSLSPLSDLRLDGAFSAASLAPQLPLAQEECPDSAAALLAWEALQSAAGQQRPQPPWFEPESLRCNRVVMVCLLMWWSFWMCFFLPNGVVFFGNWTWLDHIDMSRAGYSVWLEIWTNDIFFQSVTCDDQWHWIQSENAPRRIFRSALEDVQKDLVMPLYSEMEEAWLAASSLGCFSGDNCCPQIHSNSRSECWPRTTRRKPPSTGHVITCPLRSCMQRPPLAMQWCRKEAKEFLSSNVRLQAFFLRRDTVFWEIIGVGLCYPVVSLTLLGSREPHTHTHQSSRIHS